MIDLPDPKPSDAHWLSHECVRESVVQCIGAYT